MELSNKDNSYAVEIDFNYITNDFDENLLNEIVDEDVSDSFGSEIIFE